MEQNKNMSEDAVMDVTALRRRVRALEQAAPDDGPAVPIRFGDAALDEGLPWGGLPRGGVHEIGGDDGADVYSRDASL